MKKTKKINFFIFSLVLVFTLGACGSEVVTEPEPSEPTYELLVDDGHGVIFTSYEKDKGTPAQFKMFDNELRAILNGDTFPNSGGTPSYVLGSVKTLLVIFGVEYKDATISKVICQESNNPTKKLIFDNIDWEDLLDTQRTPLIQDRTFACTGDGRNFTVDMFKDNGASDDIFTLYFDFTGTKKFYGRLLVTEVGDEPAVDGVVLSF